MTKLGRIVLALLVAAPVGAQQSAPTNPLGQPLVDAAGHTREDAYIHIPLRPEDARYASIDGSHLKSLLMEVDSISLADRDRGTLFWGRNVGTQGHVDTEDWVARRFRAAGLQDVHRQEFPLSPQWRLSGWNITFNTHSRTIGLASARPPERAAPTPEGGLEYELVWVGQGSEADYVGRDVSGKAVLVQDIPEPGTINHTLANDRVVQRAYDEGAAAVGIVFGISDNFAAWQRTGSGPGFNVGYEDGMRLRDMLGRGERVTVKLVVESDMVPGLTASSVWGTLPGRTDEEILVIAHLDGYFEAALDNASGLAVLMGLVEHFAGVPLSERRRTIRFVGSVGHHSGPGTTWLHDHRDTALAHTALAINLEHVAVTRTQYWGPRLRMTDAVSPMRWWLYASPAVLRVVRDAFGRFNVGVTADMDPGASGEMGRMARDVPSLQVITSPEIKHTEQDTPDWVPAVGLEQIARAYAKIIDGVNELDRSQIRPAAAQ